MDVISGGQNKEAYTCHKIREVICCLKLHLLWLTYRIFRYIQFGDSLAVKVKKIILALKSSLRTSEPANWCYAFKCSAKPIHGTDGVKITEGCPVEKCPSTIYSPASLYSSFSGQKPSRTTRKLD